jgi:hypothetical protein
MSFFVAVSHDNLFSRFWIVPSAARARDCQSGMERAVKMEENEVTDIWNAVIPTEHLDCS